MAEDLQRPNWPVDGAVLVVDDEAAIRRTCAAQLEQAGCEYHTAESYEEAAAIFERERRIKVVVADHGVPHASTEEFVTGLRNSRPGVVIVGSSGSDCRSELARIGVERFLRKPWGIADLIEVLSGRITKCASCGLPLPLRRPFPGELGESWICAFCGGRYRAVIDQDSPPDTLRNARRPGED